MSGEIVNKSALAGRIRRQEGAALVVVILLLVVVTLLGLAAMRSTLLQERMAGSLMARGNAFQAAEAALREAESVAAQGALAFPAPGGGCAGGLCGRHDPSLSPLPGWQTDGFWSSGAAAEASEEVNRIRASYVIEDFGHGINEECLITDLDMSAPECDASSQVLRITVHSQGTDGATVVLQSLYEVP